MKQGLIIFKKMHSVNMKEKIINSDGKKTISLEDLNGLMARKLISSSYSFHEVVKRLN